MTFDQPLPAPPGRSLSIFLISAWVVFCLAFLPLYIQTARSYDIDFDAFYCGAQALVDGHNPYLQEPLHGCEAPLFFHDAHSAALIPAPLPGYALAALGPLARLAPPVASAIWRLLLCAAIAFTIVLLRRITRVAWIPIVAVVIASDAIVSLTIGQLVPFCVLGVVLIADALQCKRAWPIAAGMLLLCAQPQVALPVALSLLLFGSMRQRLATVVAAVVAVAGSLLAVGIAPSLAYAFTALPLQAFAELVNVNQLSLSGLLYQAGAPAAVALACGTASYVAFSLGGVIASQPLSKRLNDRAFLVLLPAACAVCAGTYVHQQMYAMAIPFGLLILRHVPDRWIAALLTIVAMPWEWVVATMYLFPMMSVTCALLSVWWFSRSAIRVAIVALFVAAGCIAASLSYINQAPPHMPSFHYQIDPQALVQYAWIAVEKTYGVIGASAGMTIARLVSLVGLCGLLIGATTVGLRSRTVVTNA